MWQGRRSGVFFVTDHLAARRAARAIVNDLCQKLNDWEAVARRLREDPSLSDPLRRAALNEVLRRATAPKEDTTTTRAEP